VIDDAACSVPGTRLKFRSRRHQLGSLALPLLLILAVVLLLATSCGCHGRRKRGLNRGTRGEKQGAVAIWGFGSAHIVSTFIIARILDPKKGEGGLGIWAEGRGRAAEFS